MLQYDVNGLFHGSILDHKVFAFFVFYLFEVIHEFDTGLFTELVNDFHERGILVV